MIEIKNFFSPEEQLNILKAIQEAERNTSGEIRVRVEHNAGKDILKTARKAFKKLGMRKTKFRNGVLFYFAIDDRMFVILGDDGINDVVPDSFWDDIRDIMNKYFKHMFFAKGLAEGIKLAGFGLKRFFPYESDDVNELPDAISFED